MITFRQIPTLHGFFVWQWVITFLALDPAVGIWAVTKLRMMLAR